MLILTSPAKTLDYTSPFQSPFQTQPLFLHDAATIVKVLKKKSKTELIELMHISSELAQLNQDRYKAWEMKHNEANSRPAIVAYAGDIFRQIHENEYTEQQAEYIQRSLRIISGLYGLVRPYDLIQPYRLEMNALLVTSSAKDLYSFWINKLTNYINKEIVSHEQPFIINLASDEYLNAIDMKEVKAKVINIIFNQQKGNEVSNIGILSKKARGMMIEFMVKNRVYDIAQLEAFDVQGYKFIAKTPDSLLFVKEIEPTNQR